MTRRDDAAAARVVERRIRQLAEIQQAAAEYAAARYKHDQVIRASRKAGIPLREIAEAAGISHEQVRRLTTDPKAMAREWYGRSSRDAGC